LGVKLMVCDALGHQVRVLSDQTVGRHRPITTVI
jgi:hypothetical protein